MRQPRSGWLLGAEPHDVWYCFWACIHFSLLLVSSWLCGCGRWVQRIPCVSWGGEGGGCVVSLTTNTVQSCSLFLAHFHPPSMQAAQKRPRVAWLVWRYCRLVMAQLQLPATATARPTAEEGTRQAVKRQVNHTFHSGWSRWTEVPSLSPNSGTPRHCLAHFCASSGSPEGSLCISPPLECTLASPAGQPPQRGGLAATAPSPSGGDQVMACPQGAQAPIMAR